MQLMNVVYVTDMARSVAFYEALGLQREGGGEINPAWNQFAIGDATLALHIQMGDVRMAGNQLELNLNLPADGSLDRLFAACQNRGIDVGKGIIKEDFGRVFWIHDPDGLSVQFNELT